MTRRFMTLLVGLLTFMITESALTSKSPVPPFEYGVVAFPILILALMTIAWRDQ